MPPAVTRTIERLEGLALVGRATFGALSLSVPALLESRRPGEPATGPSLSAVESRVGARRLVIGDGTASMTLELPVLAPEISGEAGSLVPLEHGALLVHAPVPERAAGETVDPTPSLIVLGNARALWADGVPFVRAVRDVRTRFGAAPLLWAPRVALPHRLPFLAYLGIDLVDTTEGLLAAADGTLLDPSLGVWPEPRAGAKAVERGEPVPHRPSATDLAVAAYDRATGETQRAARAGRLRELVEARLPAEPALAEMLRYADRELGELLEERSAVTSDGSHDYVIAESHRRPEMVRFRRRFLERYRPPASKTVLLLVPCSKTKPYRNSRSHRRFTGALEGLPNLERLHVVSVSSPIGLVPRELEDVPPARQYDIPVTGEWTENERAAVEGDLDHLLTRGAYRSVIAHLDPAEYGFLRPRFPAALAPRWTLTDDRTTASAALAELRAAVSEALSSETRVAGGSLAVVREELRAVAGVQFGPDAAGRLCAPPLRLAGRPWFQRLTDGRSDLATLREERGLFHLTVEGARRLMPHPPLAVSVDPRLPLTGDLFVPGVRAADVGIRVGDSVVLVRDGELAGVGEAALPGRLMTELSHGLAVRVRHRAHAPTDTSMTEEPPRTGDGPVVQR